MVGNLDTNIGRVMNHIEKLGIADRTILVFGSDNGGYIGRWQGARVTDNYPLRSGKGSLYEGGIRVPLMVRWPRTGAQGKLSEEPVISNDFFPTILDMAGLLEGVSYEQADSRSLLPLLKNPHGRLDRERLFFHYPHYYETTTPVSAVLERNWKLLQYLEDEHCELYDLTNNLPEHNDLASQQPERVVQMREQLESWRKTVNAQMPTRNPRVAFTDQQHRWDKADQELALMD
jgi:arylsulfatase A